MHLDGTIQLQQHLDCDANGQVEAGAERVVDVANDGTSARPGLEPVRQLLDVHVVVLPFSERAHGLHGSPKVSATAGLVTLPSRMLTPALRAALSLMAWSSPLVASCST